MRKLALSGACQKPLVHKTPEQRFVASLAQEILTGNVDHIERLCLLVDGRQPDAMYGRA